MDHPAARCPKAADTRTHSTPGLRIAVRHQAGAVVLTVHGEIDASTTTVLSTALAEAITERPPLLVVDLGPTRVLSCAGLSVLVTATGLAGRGTRVTVVAPSPATWRPIHLTSADRVLNVSRRLDDVFRAERPRNRYPGRGTR